MAKRFASLTEADVASKKQFLTPASTSKADKHAAKVFRDYLGEKGKNVDFANYNKDELDEALSGFYLEARTKDGKLYKRASLDTIRYGLNRYLKNVCGKDFDITSDSGFARSLESYKVAIREIKAEGRGDVEHKPHMSDSDRQKLYSSIYLSPSTPSGLQNKVQFDVRYYFGRRGSENMASMTKSSFKQHVDPNTGRTYISLVDELTKNRRTDREAASGVMAETGSADCPVQSFKKYISKLDPEEERFWCYGKDSFVPDDDVWYTKKPIGVNSLNKFLPKLSVQCQLSRVYTNHSVRATTATVLHTQQFTPAAVQSVTGHKSLSALAIYTHTSDAQKMEMSDTLHQQLCPNQLVATGHRRSTLGTFKASRPGTSASAHVTARPAASATVTSAESELIPRAEGGDSTSALRGFDYEAFFSDEFEPKEERPFTAPVFNNCTIQNLQIIYKS